MNPAQALDYTNNAHVYDDGVERLADTPINNLSQRKTNVREYITAVKEDLTKNGDTYSGAELDNMRQELMSNYRTVMDAHKAAMAKIKAEKKEVKAKEKAGLDSKLASAMYEEIQERENSLREDYNSARRDYMSGLGKIARQRYLAEMTEGKTLDEVLDYREAIQSQEPDNNGNGVDAYHKMILARRWFLNTPQTEHHAEDSSGKLSSEYGIERMQRAQERIDAMVSSLRENEKRDLTKGEQSAYECVTDHIGSLLTLFRESYEQERMMIKDAEVIPFPVENKGPQMTNKDTSRGFRGWLRRNVGGAVISAIVAIAGVCATFSGSALSNQTSYDSVPKYTVSAPVFYSMPEHKPIMDIDEIPTADLSSRSSIPAPEPLATALSRPEPPKVEPLQPDEYITKAGDNPWKLGERFFDDPHAGSDICRAYGIDNPRLMPVGLKIKTTMDGLRQVERERAAKQMADLDGQKIASNYAPHSLDRIN
jgi:hypothetical protein